MRIFLMPAVADSDKFLNLTNKTLCVTLFRNDIMNKIDT